MNASEIVSHHLRLFGFPSAGTADAAEEIVIVEGDGGTIGAADIERRAGAGQIVVVLGPSEQLALQFGIRVERLDEAPGIYSATGTGNARWARLRSLHRSSRLLCEAADALVVDRAAQPVWIWRALGRGGALFVGTELAADLVRYRQGDPAAAACRQTEPMWGIAGERPNYLFEAQLAGEARTERHADWWCEALANAVARRSGLARTPMLPGGAPGAVVITGDDDQAALGNYAKQSEMLGPLPVTYFLHPLTKHDRRSIDQLTRNRKVELGLHPDALDAPERYRQTFAEQARWFERLTGQRPLTVRNHGFLNDGYWGHAASWREHGVIASSNLPGVDGHVLNGSLLPARLWLGGELTDHWSLLTTIGDGVVFALGWSDEQCTQCVKACADRIRESGVPGVIVLNLHPDNVDRTRSLHAAARDVVADGFLAWTLRDCIAWFQGRDGSAQPSTEDAATVFAASQDLAPTYGSDNADRPSGWLRRVVERLHKVTTP